MNKYLPITMIATLAVLILQYSYIHHLYKNYMRGMYFKIEAAQKVAINDELHIREVIRGGNIPQVQHRWVYKRVSDMTPEEINNLKCRPDGNDTINLDAAKAEGLGSNAGDLMQQLTQDMYMEKNLPMNLHVLDSIFLYNLLTPIDHIFTLYDKDTIVVSVIGTLSKKRANHIFPLQPIGLKQQQFLQLKVDIPMSSFIRRQIWVLSLCACMLFIILSCVYYQYSVIRKKEDLLHKRENTINGTVHDLKSPLNTTVSMLSFLKQQVKDKDLADVIGMNEINIRNLLRHIEQLLHTGQKGYDRIYINKGLVDMSQMAEGLKSEMDMQYKAKKHSIIVSNAIPEGTVIMADATYLTNVMRNLMDNALKFSDDGVRVRVDMKVENNMLHVTVADNGWGIPNASQKYLFRPFYQVYRKEREKQGGYGLGLAQAKNIVMAHGGTISVESEEGKGSTFHFVIPIYYKL